MILQGHIVTSGGRKRGKFLPLMKSESLSHLSRTQRHFVQEMTTGLNPCCCTILDNKDADDYRRNCRAELKWSPKGKKSVEGDGKSFVLPVQPEISPGPLDSKESDAASNYKFDKKLVPARRRQKLGGKQISCLR